MIKYDYEITVNGNQAKLNKDIYLFRGNKNVHYYFAVKNASFNFKGSTDLIEKTNAINAAVTVIKPNNVEVASAIAKVENGKIHLKVTEDLIDEEVEVGDFDLVFDLFDDTDGAVTIPKVIGQFHVLERPCTTPISELVATNTTNEVDQALTDYAIVTYAEPVASTNADGTFAKKTWVAKEKITTAELNRMEEGISDVSSQCKDIANVFSHEQTETLYKLKCNGKVIATIPIGSNTQITSYTVSNNLTYCTNNNPSTEITEGDSYVATITANSGYTLSSVTVSMGGTDITSTVYSNGVINISSVTGNIVINAIANITVTPSTEPTLSYNFSNNIAGNGAGSITMSVGKSEDEGEYTIAYADDNGVLSNFASICTVNPTVENPVTYSHFNDVQMIPKYATKLVAQKGGETKAEFTIPTNKRFTNGNYGEHLYSFGAISDIHLSVETAESDFEIALTYLDSNENVAFTCVSGDCANNGTEEQLTTFKNIVNQKSPNTPVYATNGNHELYNTSFSDELWNTYVNNTRDYVFTHNNDVFIMFGITGGYDSNAFNQTQKTWLENQLEKYKTARVFLFVHPFIHNTGHANYNNLYTNIGLNAEGNCGKWLLNLIKQYTNILLINGHSHLKFIIQELSKTVTICNNVNNVETGYMLHIPSITVPRDILNGAITDYLYAQSEGVVIDVYENCILYRGRNFVDEKFIPIGQFILPVVQGSITKENYTVTNNLSNCTTNNIATSVIEDSPYNATITANSNYTLSSVTVSMGGTDITSTVYSNGVINISSVTGNIVINATAISTLKPCTNISLSDNALALNDDTLTSTLTATVTPSDTTDSIVWSSDNTDVATVNNGVVTAIGNGSCIITASCGTMIATCNVTVSLSILTTNWEFGTINSSTGVDESSTNDKRTKGYIPFDSSKTYLLTLIAPVASSETHSIKAVAIYCYDIDKKYIKRCTGLVGNNKTGNYFQPAMENKDITSNISEVSGVAYIRIRFSKQNIGEDFNLPVFDNRVILKCE